MQSSRESFALSDFKYKTDKTFEIKKRVCYFLIFLAIASIVAAALIAHFVTKNEACNTGQSGDQIGGGDGTTTTKAPEKSSTQKVSETTPPLMTNASATTTAQVTNGTSLAPTNGTSAPPTPTTQAPTNATTQGSSTPTPTTQASTNATTQGSSTPTPTTPTTSQATTTTAAPTTTPQEPPTTEAPEEYVTGVRLNRTFIPSRYEVELQPFIYPHVDSSHDFSFNGSVNITFECRENSTTLTLHGYDLTIDQSSVVISDRGQNLTSLTYDDERQFIILEYQPGLVAGVTYALGMSYNGTHNQSDYRGFYLSTYMEDGVKNYLVATQFQTTHARKAFPCFDEPSFKAIFKTTLVRHATFSTISNTNITHNVSRGGDWVADVYEETPVMSTYLNAYVVSNFTSVMCDLGTHNRQFRHWARPKYVQYLNWSCEVSGQIMEFLELYTNFSYPMTLTDQIAIPDFRAGAMENWGLVTYRETRLLYNPQHSTAINKFGIAGVIGHELAHFWFGNLVTCAWWDDTWLNEAFASFFEFPCLYNASSTQNWKSEQRFIRDNLVIMRRDDQLNDSQPIFVEGVEHHEEIGKAFSSFTYNKGAAVLRMFEFMLTKDVWRDSLRQYLAKYQYTNTKHDMLYAEVQNVTDNRTPEWDAAETNFRRIADTWIEQQNHPVVSVASNATHLSLSQKRFMDNDSRPDTNGSYMWQIDMTHATLAQLNSGSYNTTWLYGKPQVSLETSAPPLVANIRGRTFARINYDSAGWNSTIRQLRDNHTMFSAETKAHLIDDAFRLARAGDVSETLALDVASYLVNETEYAPFWAAFDSTYGGFQYMDRKLRYSDTYPQFVRYVQDLVAPVMTHINVDVDPTAEVTGEMMSRLMIRTACYFRLPACLDLMTDKFSAWMNTGAQISPDTRFYMYCYGVEAGGVREWEEVLKEHERVEEDEDNVWYVEELSRLDQALTCTREPYLIRRYLAHGKNSSSAISTRLSRAVTTPVGRLVTYDYLTSNWADLHEDTRKIDRLRTIFSWYSEQGRVTELEALKVRLNMTKEEQKDVDEMIKGIHEDSDWLDTNEEPIAHWLECRKTGSDTCWSPVSRSSVVTVNDTPREQYETDDSDHGEEY